MWKKQREKEEEVHHFIYYDKWKIPEASGWYHNEEGHLITETTGARRLEAEEKFHDIFPIGSFKSSPTLFTNGTEIP